MDAICVITGDIINSRKDEISSWIDTLSAYFDTIGPRKTTWDIYRGDSFQLLIKEENPIKVVFIIKSLIKQQREIDVRLSIGIGNITFKSDYITESNGSAFVNSGEKFDSLDKNTMGIKTSFPEFDEYFNIILNLSEKITESWKPMTAKVIHHALRNEKITQKELSYLLRKSEASISRALSRGGYSEILKVIELYKNNIEKHAANTD